MTTLVRIWVSILLLTLAAYGGFTFYRMTRAETASDDGGLPPGTKLKDGSAKDHSDAALTPPNEINWDNLAKVRLTERSGDTFEFSQLKGKVWLLNFFFASCPGTCRQINNDLAVLQQYFKDNNLDVTIVSVSVDPENDTPAVLAQYAQVFGADKDKWLFLTGDFEVIRALCQDTFKIPVERKVHAERSVLVDRNLKQQGTYHPSKPELVALLKKKLPEVLAIPVASQP